MAPKIRKISIAILVSFACGAIGSAQAQQFENPSVASAKSVLGPLSRGANYQVENLVQGDGFLRFYVLNTRHGRFEITGHELLLARIRELAALRQLEKVSQGRTFAKGVVKSATKPAKLAVDVVKAPVRTVGRTVSGVFGIFDRVASGIGNMGSDPDNVVANLVGVGSAKRALGVKLGIDPYTDFKPVANRLHKIARASALGELGLSVAIGQIGTVGLVVSRTITAQNLSTLIRDKTPSQLVDINRGKLQKMGVRGPEIRLFLANKNYTITDKTAIVLALEQMRGVGNKGLFVARAAQARSRHLAYFLRRRAEMLAYYHVRTAPLANFLNVAGFPLNQKRDGRVLALLPLDFLVWTKTSNNAFVVVSEDLRRRNLISGAELRITGIATPLAQRNLRKLGWMVAQNTPR
jgi:hypothetical protein